MGCIQVFETHQPNPLVFSSAIVFLILLLRISKLDSVSEQNFNLYAMLSLMIVFLISLDGVTCPTPCVPPCNIYSQLKENGGFYGYITWEVIVETLLFLGVLKLYKLVIVKKNNNNMNSEAEEINYMYLIFLCLHVIVITTGFILISFLSLIFNGIFMGIFLYQS